MDNAPPPSHILPIEETTRTTFVLSIAIGYEQMT